VSSSTESPNSNVASVSELSNGTVFIKPMGSIVAITLDMLCAFANWQRQNMLTSHTPEDTIFDKLISVFSEKNLKD
jgi:hypothetical protein